MAAFVSSHWYGFFSVDIHRHPASAELKVCFLQKTFYKFYGPFIWMRFNCLEATESLQRDSLLFTAAPGRMIKGVPERMKG